MLRRAAGESWGLRANLLLDCGLLQISEVQPGGSTDMWNQAHDEEERVHHGDWILSVNGNNSDVGAMIHEFHCCNELELVISAERPACPTPATSPTSRLPVHDTEAVGEQMRFPVTVEITENVSLGVMVSVSSGGLEIVRLMDGAVEAWNTNNPSKEVRVGDRVVFANGGTLSDMLAAMRQVGTVHMVIYRGPRCSDDKSGLVLSESDVERIPVVRLTADDVCQSDGGVCGICLEEWVEGEEVMQLPCTHRFHKECAAPWLTKHSALCPLCAWAADLGCCSCRGDPTAICPCTADADDIGDTTPQISRLPPSDIAGSLQALRSRFAS